MSKRGALAFEGAGPRVVALGGGHGLAATVRALRRVTDQITAVVGVADDGGSVMTLGAVPGARWCSTDSVVKAI